MADITGILPPNWLEKAKKDLAPRPVEEQIHDAMAQAGVTSPDHITIDGEIHRFKTTGKDKSGWYVFFPDNIIAGSFGDWKEGIEQNFCANVGRALTEQELQQQKARIKQAKDRREQEQREKQAEVATSVAHIWEKSQPASADHPYLKRKCINPNNARLCSDGRLIVPLFDEKGDISSIQYISHDGSKLYHKGGKTGGCFNIIGGMDGSEIYIAEGFATAATIHEVTGKPCAAAYSASNIVKVAEILAPLVKSITIVADNDRSGVGQKYAYQASAKFGCQVIIPPDKGDANDYVANGGDLLALLTAENNSSWLISASDFLHDFKPISWLIKGVIPKSSSVLLFGPSGAGKSFLLLDWMMHIATGKTEWQGRKVRPGYVVYLAGEGHHGIKGRMKAWLQEFGDYNTKINMHISRTSLDLDTPEGIATVLRELSLLPEKPAAIILDTVNRFMSGDENSSQDVRNIINAADKIRHLYPESTNIFTSHTGVSDAAQKRVRGSSAWKASMEVELCLSVSDETIELSQIKAKDGKAMEPFYFTLKDTPLDSIFDEDGEQVTSAIIDKTDAPETSGKSDKESKNDRHMRELVMAFDYLGAEFIDNQAYISRSGLIRFYTEQMGRTEGGARQIVKESANGKIINELLVNGLIKKEAHGWVIVDNVVNSSLLLQYKK